MILEMVKLRLLGPRSLLAPTVRAIQDEAVVQLAEAPSVGTFVPCADDLALRRRRHHLARALARIDDAIALLAELGAPIRHRARIAMSESRADWLGARVLADVRRLVDREHALDQERDAIRIYEPLFAEIDALGARSSNHVSIFLLRLRTPGAFDELRASLEKTLPGAHDLRPHVMTSGEVLALLLVPAARATEIDRKLGAAHVEPAMLPAALGAGTAEALTRLRPRLREVERELAEIRGDAEAIARSHGEELASARQTIHDAQLLLDAESRAATSQRSFVLEGWLPARDRDRLAKALARTVGPAVSLEVVDRHDWEGKDAPVVLANPRIFAPFEILTSLLPLPVYGSVDPTPFVAVFFPMLFGVIVGDVGYGLVLALLAALIRILGRRKKTARDLSKIAGAVSLYTIVFGFCYGEAFGDLGTRAFGLTPLWFDRQEAVLAFLILAISLGAGHLVIGLVVAAASRWRRHRRQAIGRGLTAVMLCLLCLALLALFEQVPHVLLMPAVIALLAALVVVIVLEGATAILDLMTIVNHALSYARVMALGTASVMLAIVANRMQGAFGSLALGIAFALLFHIINFAITLFSPTIHVMRLHYVEFFETFFEPGGGPYRPLRHWSAEPATG